MQSLKIYGERNTGTNYLKQLLESNLNVHLLRGTVPRKHPLCYNEFTKNVYFHFTSKYNLGWKHSFVDRDFVKKNTCLTNTYFIFLVKNPYSFLLSLYKKSYHFIGNKPETFQNFLNHTWRLQKRDNLKAKSLESPVFLWNFKVSSYLEYMDDQPGNSMLIKYEDLVNDPKKTLQTIADSFSLNKKTSFINITSSTKPDNKRFEDYQDYYLNEKWRNNIEYSEIELINKYLDKELVHRLGYKIIQTTE